MQCYLYARSATRTQGRVANSVAAQLRALRQSAKARGWTVAGEYSDEGVSGLERDRPGLRQMLTAAPRNEQLGAVLVSSLDRLSRSPADLVRVVKRLQGRRLPLIVPLDQEKKVKGNRGAARERAEMMIARWFAAWDARRKTSS